MDEETRKEEIQLHKEQVARGKRPAMWKAFSKYVLTEVMVYRSLGHWGLELTDEAASDGNGFVIHRRSFPNLVVECRFMDRSIECSFRYRRSDEADTVEWHETIGFAVDHLDNVQFTHKGVRLLDHVEATKITVLAPILNPYFVPPQL